MGVVTRAYDPKLNRDVAIKAIAEGGKTPPGVAERLRREAMMLARVSHPKVARVFGAGQPPETLYYVMELLPGTSLESRLAAEPGPNRFDTKEFLEPFTPLSDAFQVVAEPNRPARARSETTVCGCGPDIPSSSTNRRVVFRTCSFLCSEFQSHRTSQNLMVESPRQSQVRTWRWRANVQQDIAYHRGFHDCIEPRASCSQPGATRWKDR
ncbi:MAG: protein kinase [Candidatus Wallbacteria bacterium]|nr:protein kinase [Candidatus Wallbacteria bacterium]